MIFNFNEKEYWQDVFRITKLDAGGKHSPAIVDRLRGEHLPLIVLSEGKH